MPESAREILTRILGPAKMAALATAGPSETGERRLTVEEQREWFSSRALRLHEAMAGPEFASARASHPEVRAWVERWLVDPRRAGSLLILGDVGVGKTHEAYGALYALAEAGLRAIRAVAVSEARLYALLRPGSIEHDIASERDRRVATYAGADVLLLDDLGSAKVSEWTTDEVIFPVIDHRYRNQLPTLITSNYGTAEIREMYGPRTHSRLAAMCRVVNVEGRDRRMP